ncbi:MAG: hypothetical protein ABW123_05055 [Cystobacter sp.]
MSDSAEWKGRRLGAYVVGKRFAGIPEDEGRIYAAHHAETGEPVLVMRPGLGDDWRLSTPWAVETTYFSDPAALVLHPRRGKDIAWPGSHALTLGHIQLAGALAQLDGRDDVRSHLADEPRPVQGRHRTKRWGLAGLAVAAGLALLLWPRESTPPETRAAHDDAPILANRQRSSSTAIAYPMPETPLKEQARPPCIPETEVEVRGGCWIKHEKVAPCPRGTAEHKGKCYVAVKKPDPEPTSIQP